MVKVKRLIRFIHSREWDRRGVFLACLLVVGEGTAVGVAVWSFFDDGSYLASVAALVGAAVLLVYVPLAVFLDRLPFAPPSEYERRRRYAEWILAYDVPKRPLAGRDAQVVIEDGSPASILGAVGQAYALGDKAFEDFCRRPWVSTVAHNVQMARLLLLEYQPSPVSIICPPSFVHTRDRPL